MNKDYYNIPFSLQCIVREWLYVLGYVFFSYFVYGKSRNPVPDVVFYCGYGNMPGNKPWDGTSLSRGIGGAESCVIHLAQELARDNLQVVIYCDCNVEKTCESGVVYKPSTQFDYKTTYTTIILWRYPFAAGFISAKKKIGWLHDPGIMILFDIVHRSWVLQRIYGWWIRDTIWVVPSQYMKKRCEPYVSVLHIPNGVPVHPTLSTELVSPIATSFVDQRRKNSFVWHTNLNRGLEDLIAAFPTVLQEFPDAHLFVCNEPCFYIHTRAEKIMRDIQQDFITYMGLLSHQETLDLLRKTDFFCYPASIPESFSLCSWEAAANGCIPFLYDSGALNELSESVSNRGVLPDHHIVPVGQMETLIDRVMYLMRHPDEKERIRVSMQRKTSLGWNPISKQWKEQFHM